MNGLTGLHSIRQGNFGTPSEKVSKLRRESRAKQLCHTKKYI